VLPLLLLVGVDDEGPPSRASLALGQGCLRLKSRSDHHRLGELAHQQVEGPLGQIKGPTVNLLGYPFGLLRRFLPISEHRVRMIPEAHPHASSW